MPVSPRHFGAIYSAYPQDADFLSVLDEIGLHIGRWPGGTLAETRPDVYDIGSAQILDPTTLFATNPSRVRLLLEEALQFSGDAQTINIVIPTYRYEADVEQGEADLTSLLQNLSQKPSLSGSIVRLEIGNEYYDSDELTAGEYGAMVDRFLSTVSAFGSDFGSISELEILVQMGRTTAENLDILGQIDPNRLALIDGVVAHTLPINLTNLYNDPQISPPGDRFSGILDRLFDWELAMAPYEQEAPELHITAWTVGASVSDPNDVDLAFQDYGARGAVTTVALFGEIIRAGAEEATAWGVGVSNLNTLGTGNGGSPNLSHSGTVLKELNDSVIGLELHQISGRFEWSDQDIEFGTHVYHGNGRMVVYAANGEDIVGSTKDLSSYAVGFDLDTAILVESKRIETEFESGYTPQGNEQDRLYETPSVIDLLTNGAVELTSPWLSINHTEDHQVSEHTITWLHRGGNTGDELQGYQFDDRFDGMGGDDSIHGNDGADSLFGSGGDDEISGGDDNDFIDGGVGNDVLLGDDGNDFIAGEEGSDTLVGGEGDDSLDGGGGNDIFYGDGVDSFEFNDLLASSIASPVPPDSSVEVVFENDPTVLLLDLNRCAIVEYDAKKDLHSPYVDEHCSTKLGLDVITESEIGLI